MDATTSPPNPTMAPITPELVGILVFCIRPPSISEPWRPSRPDISVIRRPRISGSPSDNDPRPAASNSMGANEKTE
jgi:hypothetical protein